MKIASKVSDVCIKSVNPHFKYHFKESGIPLEISKEHVEKILMNTDFYESDKLVKKNEKPTKKEVEVKSFSDELIEINGIGEKTAKDILIVFPTKGDLLEALSKGERLPFADDVEKKLKEVFIS